MRSERGGALLFALDGRRLRLSVVGSGIRQALRLIADKGAAESKLADVVLEVDGAAALPRMYYCLHSLQAFGAVSYVLRQGSRMLARLSPAAGSSWMTLPAVMPDKQYRLSRFAYLRRDDECLALQSPSSGAELELRDGRALVMIAALARPRTVRDLAVAAVGTDLATARTFVSLLAGAGMLDDAERGAGDWSFADFVFHASTREGRRHPTEPRESRGRQGSPPAIKPAMSAAVIQLERPDVKALQLRDVPFTRVLASRRSLRSYGVLPLSASKLGEFLFRVARVKRVSSSRQREGARQLTRRPYPSGGSRYGLELYAIIGACRDIPRGMYHYDPLGHRLEALAAPEADVDGLLRRAAAAAGRSAEPQVLIVIAARFRRVTWKYRSMAYPLVLKEVGGLYQTMYLVATAMKLAPCALGGGDPGRFARLIGTDFFEETSVGEFLLGSRPTRREGPSLRAAGRRGSG
ncbi:MAG: SagB/ThcOx family dehydrogenase, partial [Gemmatimonadales bacterium]